MERPALLKNTVIIQNTYQPSHSVSLEAASGGRALYVQLRIFKELLKIVLGRSKIKIHLAIFGMLYFLTLRFQQPKSIFVFLAPFDWRILIVALFAGPRHDVTVVTSQLNWDQNATIRPMLPIITKFWIKFSSRCKFVGLNDIAYQNAPPTFRKKYLIYHTVTPTPSKPLFSTESIVVGYAGRLVREKGIFDLLNAAERNPHLEFHFAGWGKLKNEITNSNLSNVFYHGTLHGQRLYEFYSACDCITQLSVVRRSNRTEWQDVFGLSVAEALCFGCTPFISDLPAPSKVFHRLTSQTLKLVPIVQNRIDPDDIDFVLNGLRKKEHTFQIPKLISNEYNQDLWKKVILSES